jgi:hypothetical protein
MGTYRQEVSLLKNITLISKDDLWRKTGLMKKPIKMKTSVSLFASTPLSGQSMQGLTGKMNRVMTGGPETSAEEEKGKNCVLWYEFRRFPCRREIFFHALNWNK